MAAVAVGRTSVLRLLPGHGGCGRGRGCGDLRPVVRANTTVVQTAACVAGLGIALFPSFVARREARLVRVLAGAPTPSRDLYAVVHGDLRENARVRAVLGWLAATVAVTLF